MATRRGKTQARRNHGNSGGLPGWAWGVIGLLLGVALILAAPRLLRSDGDGFFRPRPNPDAEPAPVAIDDADVVATDDDDSASAGPDRSAAKGTDKGTDKGTEKGADYDFYTLLPGKEVALSDAELAATERAETRRAALPVTAAVTAAAAPATTALPPPVGTGAEVVPTKATMPPVAPPAATRPVAATATAATSDTTPYLLQAGAFQASGQAEELKARIGLLGLGARVESASIGGKTVYRVRMGPYGTAGDLAEAKRKLASGGLPGMAIKVQ